MQNDPLQISIEQARDAAQVGDFASAAEIQERVVMHLRLNTKTGDDLVMLGVQLFNLADYYTGLERFTDAIRLMEEVVALDEKIGHPDIDSDRQMLDQVRRLADMTPEQRTQFYASTPQAQPTVSYLADPVKDMIAQLDSLPPEEREDLEALVREMQGLSPEEQVARAMEIMQRRNNEI
jgi:hypothetical protein